MAEDVTQPIKPQHPIATSLYGWLQALIFALLILILVFTFLGRIIGVEGSSMYPTLHDRDMLFLQAVGYEPQQGDVIILKKEFATINSPIVKRVIATGGQTVEINYAEGYVAVDGETLNEPYINEAMYRTGDPYMTNDSVLVPEGSVFVMGDNRNHSSDSRDVRLGTIDERYILGEAVLILFPFQSFGLIS